MELGKLSCLRLWSKRVELLFSQECPFAGNYENTTLITHHSRSTTLHTLWISSLYCLTNSERPNMTSFVSPAVSALEMVYLAFEAVKTNKEHLRSIVKRCEIVVDNLRLVVEERGELWSDLPRIEHLVTYDTSLSKI